MRATRVIPTALLAGLFLTLPGTLPGIGGLGGPPTAEAATAASAAEQMLTLVNAERSKAGCKPVRLDSRLNAATSKHSTDMATNNYFSHTSRDGRSFVTRIKAEGYPTARSENIAAGNTTAQATFTQNGMLLVSVQWPEAISASVITPIVFCASLVPWASATIDPETIWPSLKPFATVPWAARAVIR